MTSPSMPSRSMLEAGGKSSTSTAVPPQSGRLVRRGKLDLLTGSFIDPSRCIATPEATSGRGAPVIAGGKPLKMDLCMIQPRVVNWHDDGTAFPARRRRGRHVSLFENTVAARSGATSGRAATLEQVDPYVKSGALSRPFAADWNGDGKLDIIAATRPATSVFREHRHHASRPRSRTAAILKPAVKPSARWPDRTVPYRARRRPSGATPIPRWPTGISTANSTSVVNDIWGDVVWYRNTGTKAKPELAPAAACRSRMGRTPAEARLGLVGAESETTRHPVAHHAVRRRLGPRRPARSRHAQPSGLPVAVPPRRQNNELKLLPPERIFLNPAAGFSIMAPDAPVERPPQSRTCRLGWRRRPRPDHRLRWGPTGGMKTPVPGKAGPDSPRPCREAKSKGTTPLRCCGLEWRRTSGSARRSRRGFFYFFDRTYIEAQH